MAFVFFIRVIAIFLIQQTVALHPFLTLTIIFLSKMARPAKRGKVIPQTKKKKLKISTSKATKKSNYVSVFSRKVSKGLCK